VEDDEFWEGLVPLEIGGIPRLQDEVTVVGYPTGGDNMSVTAGVVSRVSVSKYVHSGRTLLAVQIDAAINAGNSGGPALQGITVVGVAFESMGGDAENIGYIIPPPVIKHFLKDIEVHGMYRGIVSMGTKIQKIENQGMRDSLQIPEEFKNSGVLVNKIFPLYWKEGKLKRNDVLLKLDDITIGCDGTIPFRGNERVFFTYLTSSKFVGDSIAITVVRDGKVLTFDKLLGRKSGLVPKTMFDQKPSYLVFGGLVFTPCSAPLLQAEYGNKWRLNAPIHLVDKTFFGAATRDEEEVIVLTSVLVGDVNLGYERHNVQVLKANGVPLLNLKHLKTLLYEDFSDSKFLRLDLFNESILMLDMQAARDQEAQILSENSIMAPMSADLVTDQPAEKVTKKRRLNSGVEQTS
jgi:hypothetical protein